MTAGRRDGSADVLDVGAARSLRTAAIRPEGVWSEDPVAQAQVPREDAVFGRDVELDVVAGFLEAAASGPAALIVRGEPGIGKTTMWNAARTRARSASFTVLSCRPGSAEVELPYAGLGDLFAEVPAEILNALPEPQRRALDVALLKADVGDTPLQQRAVSAAALHVIMGLARSAPVLLAIDDVQWLDPPTIRVLRFAARRVGAATIGILVARRTDVSDDDCLQLGDALPADRVVRMVVGPLELPALDGLLRSHLRVSFLGKTLRQLHETSRGNPLFAIELGRALLDPDSHSVPGQTFPAPSSLPELLAARLGRVPPRAREALLAASALARPTVDSVLAASADDGVDSASLHDAVDAGVITIQGDAISFTHPLLSSVLYASAPGEQRRRVHRRLAALSLDPEERARHYGLSTDSPDPEISATVEDAARRAAARGAPDAAAVLLEQAAGLTPPSLVNDVIRRTLDAADYHVAAGDTTRARHLLEDVLAAAGSGVQRARALHRLSRICVLEGEMTKAPSLLRSALEENRGSLPLRASIERDLVWCLAQNGEVSHLTEHAEAALRTAETVGDPSLIAEALSHLCMAAFLVGDNVEPELVARALAVDDEVRAATGVQHPAIAAGRQPLALTLKWTDDFDRARALLESMWTEHLDRGDEGALAPVLFHLGELECWAGNWAAAANLAEAGHALGTRTGQAVADMRALTLDAMIASHQGDADAARSIAGRSLTVADAAGDAPATIRSLASLGLVEMAVGDLEAALAHLERATNLESSIGYSPAVLRTMPDTIEALLAVDRVDDAAHLVATLEQHAAQSQLPWGSATAARCRGLLEATHGRLDAAQTALERAVQEHDRLPQPFERARTLLALGTVQRRAKQKRAARESLNTALRLFEAQGAMLWAARTSGELARISGRASSPLALTPTEEQVATLVADGRTNREVGGSLFMSVKTVETNLTHIYRKLGITSRRELAACMHRPELTPREASNRG